MIKLTPIEIERHDFKTVWRGYDPDEVRAFLAQIAQQLTALVREQEKAEETLALKAQRLAQVEDYESKLRDALLAASTLAEQTREEARREAELTIREAEVRADQILRDGRQALQSIMSETQTLKRQRERLNVELRSVVESHLRMLENQEENLKSSRARWQDEEEQWQEMASSLFSRGGDESRSEGEGDALLEARELTLALGSGIGDDELSSSAETARDSRRDHSAEVISPTLPEPLTKRPLVAPRLGDKDKSESSASATPSLNIKPSLSERSTHSTSQTASSDEPSSERSGLMKLQKVLSEVPRKADEK